MKLLAAIAAQTEAAAASGFSMRAATGPVIAGITMAHMATVDQASEAEALFRDYHDRIHRYILSMARNPAEAEDLTQDTFLRAYCARGSLRDPNAVRGWLYRIATHVCLDRLRQRVPHISLDGEEGVGCRDSVAADSPSALEIAERAQTSLCVQRCLDFLSDSYRAVILLHEAHGLTAEQIAELLGESLGAVKIRLHRARRKLQEVMAIGCAVSESRSGVPCCEPKAPC
jgi:RNA polymerase sigma-70 factor (ECF subfamily)